VNVLTQIGNGPVTSLYGPSTYPSLSLQRSFLLDPAPNFTHIFANDGFYTDLKLVATWNTASSSNDQTAGLAAPVTTSTGDVQGPTITRAQLEALRTVHGLPSSLGASVTAESLRELLRSARPLRSTVP
jgi:hypothetical protein